MNKTIYRLWLGPRALPREYSFYEDEWRRLNPDWDVVTLTEATFTPEENVDVVTDLYRRDAGRQGVELYVQLADVLAYEIIHRLGGVYVNVDMQPVRPIPDDFVTKAFASYEDDLGNVVNAAIGAPETGDPFWELIIRQLSPRYFSWPGGPMNATTGPGLLTDTYNLHPDMLEVKPRETFNYVHWSQIEWGSDAAHLVHDLPPEVLAIHHWGHKKARRTNYVETATQ